jgi:hypothetical protein
MNDPTYERTENDSRRRFYRARLNDKLIYMNKLLRKENNKLKKENYKLENFDNSQPVFLTGTRPHTFRPGEPSQIIGVQWCKSDAFPGLPCFQVLFLDGQTGFIPISDLDNYSLSGDG